MKTVIKNITRPFYRWFTLRWFSFSSHGRDVYVNHRVHVSYARRIRLGSFVHVHYGSELIAGPDSEIVLEDGCRIGPYATLQAKVGFIRMGANTYVGPQAILRGDGGLEIGKDVLISPQVVVMSANHVFSETTMPIRLQGETRQGIVIEDDVWLGAGVKVLDGVRVGHGVVIGAGAVVTCDIPAYSVVAGVPGRVIRSRTDL